MERLLRAEEMRLQPTAEMWFQLTAEMWFQLTADYALARFGRESGVQQVRKSCVGSLIGLWNICASILFKKLRLLAAWGCKRAFEDAKDEFFRRFMGGKLPELLLWVAKVDPAGSLRC